MSGTFDFRTSHKFDTYITMSEISQKFDTPPAYMGCLCFWKVLKLRNSCTGISGSIHLFPH